MVPPRAFRHPPESGCTPLSPTGTEILEKREPLWAKRGPKQGMETYVSVPERRRLLRGLPSSARKPGEGFHPIRENLAQVGQ